MTVKKEKTFTEQEELEELLSTFFNSFKQCVNRAWTIDKDLMKRLQSHALYWKNHSLPQQDMASSFFNGIIRLAIEHGIKLTPEGISRAQKAREAYLRSEKL